MHRNLRLAIRGAVQGVGFRPFVWRLADELGLAGFVANDVAGVTLEVEGPRDALERFLVRLEAERPAAAEIESRDVQWSDPAGHRGFEIRASGEAGERTVQVLPDLATCAACLREVLDPADRRHRYPFANCTHCGPRFSIVRSLPYDRARTTMEPFAMCQACRSEYESPADRRFHAQPIACPACGPRLALWDAAGETTATGPAALDAAVLALSRGEVVAVKGLGGFHLMVDARSAGAVAALRTRKLRREKPLALMVADPEAARRLCRVDDREAAVLSSPEAPILLLRRRPEAGVDPGIAPGNPYLGVMLPSTPLHHLLLGATGFPVVATSGNLSEEPICTEEREAGARLGGIADRFLVHDRPIARHVDDSVAWVIDGVPRVLRRARGFAPRPVRLARPVPVILAVGAHLKNTVALAVKRQVFVSQHIGDMETPEARAAFERVIADFLLLYEARPVALAHDRHPDYASTRWAREAARRDGTPLVAVQHHHAHLASCLADNGAAGPALGVAWDGTGHGPDGTVWGGEFLLGDAASFRRVAHLRTFRLPGGEAAVREPRRAALAVLWELLGEEAMSREDLAPVRSFHPAERRVLAAMLASGVESPVTSSAGRLFDAVAALLGLRQKTSFEGQAAMELEFAADPAVRDAWPIEIGNQEGALILDWRPLIEALIADLRRGAEVAAMAGRFHNGLVQAIVGVARAVGEPRVALTGGCFQNRLLTERCLERLRAEGFEVLLHRQVPPNDGGICLGQVAVAAERYKLGDRLPDVTV